MVMRASEFFRPDQGIDEVCGDAGRDDAGDEIIHGRSHPRAGCDISHREQKKADARGQESKVEHDAPPSGRKSRLKPV
jgi:hypothetical protein